jgi:MFS transporter, DHA1 family, multidrug resistance protein
MKWFSDDIRPLVPLYLTMFMEAVGCGLAASVLNVVAKQDLGCSNFQIGIIWAGFNVAQIVGSVLMGYLSDHVRRKYVLALVLIWMSGGYIFTALSSNFTMFLLSRIFTGLFGGSYSIAASILSLNLTLDRLPRAIGILGTVMSLGFAIGPLISTLITGLFYEEGKNEAHMQRSYFYSASGIYLVAALAASRLSSTVAPVQTKEVQEKSCGVLTKGLVLVWSSRFFATCGITSIYITQQTLWSEFLKLNRIWITLSATASGLTVSLVQGLVFPYCDKKFTSHVALATGIGLVGIASLVIGPVTSQGNIPLHYLCLVVFWFGIGLLEPGTPVVVSKHLRVFPLVRQPLRASTAVPQPRTLIHTGLAMGITSAMKYAASLVVPMAIGYMFDVHNVLVYYVSGAVTLLGTVAVVIARISYQSDQKEACELALVKEADEEEGASTVDPTPSHAS